MPTTRETGRGPAAGAAEAPPPARVTGNRWTAIEVDEPGALEPVASVSVVVLGDDPDRRLPLTLAALASQTYPASLTDVVLPSAHAGGDDASLREAAGDLIVTFAEADGGSLSEPAAAARGDVLLFLPAGALPDRGLVKAHARWHHAVADAVSVGTSHGVDAGSLEVADVPRAQREGALDALLAPSLPPGRGDEEVLEKYLERTRELTERRPDLFRVAARGSVAMRAETYRAAVGAEPTHALDQAMARLDLAYRLDCLGCVFVAERAARSFDHYPDTGPALRGAVDDLLEDQPVETARPDPRVADLIPAAGFRSRDSSRMHTRPAMVVNVAVGDEGAEEVLETVDGVLRGHFQDLELRLVGADEHPDRELIEQACASDPRIAIGPPSLAGRSLAAYQVSLPAVAVPDERTFEDIHELMTEEGMGALHVTVPGELPRLAMVEAVATGPLARAERVAAVDGEDVEIVLGRLFGERWVSGVEVSIRRRGAPEPQVTEHGPLSRATDLDHERAQRLRHSSRAATNQGKADRYAERAERDRLRARAERRRADAIEARIAHTEASPAYTLMRPVRRLGGMLRARLRR